MGDDLMDLPLLQRVGLPIGVPNGHPLTRRNVDFVTRNSGGWGAVREVAEELLKSQGKWGRCESLLLGFWRSKPRELSH